MSGEGAAAENGDAPRRSDAEPAHPSAESSQTQASSGSAPSAPSVSQLRSRLMQQLEKLSVKSIVELRSSTSVTPTTEAVVIGTLYLACGVEASPAAPKSWQEAKAVLLRPGSLLNSLRRFPYAAERGQITFEMIEHASELLQDLPSSEEDLKAEIETQPLVGQLHEWLRLAVDYARPYVSGRLPLEILPSPLKILSPSQSMNLDKSLKSLGEHSPARTNRSGFSVSWAVLAEPEDRSRSPSPSMDPRSNNSSVVLNSALGAGVNGGVTATSSNMSNANSHLGNRTTSPAGAASLGSGMLGVSGASTPLGSSAVVGAAAGSAAPSSPSAWRRTPVSGVSASSTAAAGGYAPVLAGQGSSHTASSSNLASSSSKTGLAANIDDTNSNTNNHDSHSTTSVGNRDPAAESGIRDGRVTGPPSGRRSQPGYGQAPRPLPMPPSVTAPRGSSPGRVPPAPLHRASSPQRAVSPRRNATSPLKWASASSRAAAEAAESRSPSPSPLAVRPRSPLRSPRPASPRTSSQRVTGLEVSDFTSVTSRATMPSVDETKEHQKTLEAAQLELREMKAMETKLRWALQREEKRQVALEAREEALEIMEWREQQSIEMREYVQEKNREQRLRELMRSRDYQLFKRQWKKAMKEKVIREAQEQLLADMEFTRMQLEMKREVMAEDNQVLADQAENRQEEKEIKALQAKAAKVDYEANKAHEIQTEMNHQINLVEAAKEKMLWDLQYLQDASKMPVPIHRLGGMPRQPSPLNSRRSVSPVRGAVRSPSPPRFAFGQPPRAGNLAATASAYPARATSPTGRGATLPASSTTAGAPPRPSAGLGRPSATSPARSATSPLSRGAPKMPARPTNTAAPTPASFTGSGTTRTRQSLGSPRPRPQSPGSSTVASRTAIGGGGGGSRTNGSATAGAPASAGARLRATDVGGTGAKAAAPKRSPVPSTAKTGVRRSSPTPASELERLH